MLATVLPESRVPTPRSGKLLSILNVMIRDVLRWEQLNLVKNP